MSDKKKVAISKDVIGIIGDSKFRVTEITLKTVTLINTKFNNVLKLDRIAYEAGTAIKGNIAIEEGLELAAGAVIVFGEDGVSTEIVTAAEAGNGATPSRKTPPACKENPN
jgi:hypothetical protein